ncbi:MAG: thiopurine S-methyltransferase [Pseudomonadota bacterium]|nr:thiopurine S-methyltransferase [Pseudomonadota bacterium]
MNPDFWQERWTRGEIGFHRSDVHPLLAGHWPTFAIPAGTRVLVPLCGKSVDMIFLAEQGQQVVGIELSHLAAEAFFSQAKLEPAQERRGGFDVWSGGPYQIWVGDFFELTPKLIGTFDAVYDRAALIALPETLRTRYATQIGDLVTRGSEALLIALDYPLGEMNGPPFSVSSQEIHQLFGTHANVQCLERIDILSEEPRFIQKGLSALTESAYRISFHP